MEQMLRLTDNFILSSRPVKVVPFGNGHINDSFKVTTEDPARPDYLLQRINHSVFTDVELLQSNIEAVTSHIRGKLKERGEKEIDRKVLRLVFTPGGKTYHFDGFNYWRMMEFIPGSKSAEILTPDSARDTGLAFGDFQRMLSDIPEGIGETIPNFHNMEFRIEQLRQAVADDRAGRAGACREIIEALEQRAEYMCTGERLHRQGKLPKRICHCDTKLNNILFDRDGSILCAIDLDTVMPSFIFSDVGDFMRTGACTAPEDEPDLSKIDFGMDIFRSFTEGYLKAAGGFLTPVEIENIPYAVALFPYMQTVRFLADYLNGDTYYKISYPEHNLVRTKAQLRLLEIIESLIPTMERFINSC